MFFDYKEMELSKSALEQKLLLSAGEYEKTVREAALGGASSAEVQSKKAEMESDENSLESMNVNMEKLLDNVREKQQGLLASETSLQLAAKNQSSADIKLSSGLISRQEYIGLKLNYIDEQNSAEKAKLDYSRAVFDYEQAVTRGVINI